MGGVDLADEKVRSYEHNTQTYVMVHEVALLSLKSCDNDAYILESRSPCHNPPVTQKAQQMLPFCQELIKNLIGGRVYWKRQNSKNSLPYEPRFNLSLSDPSFTAYKIPLQSSYAAG